MPLAPQLTDHVSLDPNKDQESPLIISYSVNAPTSDKTIKTFLKSIGSLGIPNLSVDESKLQINAKSFDVVFAAAYQYLNTNPDNMSENDLQYLENICNNIATSMWPSNVEIIDGTNKYEGFSHPRAMNLLGDAFELIGFFETKYLLGPKEGEKMTAELPDLSRTLEHMGDGVQFCMSANNPNDAAQLEPVLEALHSILAKVSNDTTLCKLEKNDQGFSVLSISDNNLHSLCDVVEGYFRESGLLGLEHSLDLSPSNDDFVFAPSDLASLPMQPYISYNHCVAAFHQAAEGAMCDNIVCDIRNMIQVEDITVNNLGNLNQVNSHYIAH